MFVGAIVGGGLAVAAGAGAAGIAAGAVAGGVMGYMNNSAAEASADAATQGAQMANDAANRVADLQWKAYNQTRSDQLPWLKIGARQLKKVEKEVNRGYEHEETPVYKWELGQGLNALNKQLNAQGQLGSGAALTEGVKFATGLAKQDYVTGAKLWLDTVINPKLALSGSGQVAGAGLGEVGSQTAKVAGEALWEGGNALATGRIQAGNAEAQGMNNLNNMIGFGIDKLGTYNKWW